MVKQGGTVMVFNYTDKQLNELKHGKECMRCQC